MHDAELATLRSTQLKATSPTRRKPEFSNSLVRGVMTFARLKALLRDRYGAGRDETYTPWIRVTRSTSSPVSHTIVAATPVHARGLHLLSKLEKTAANVAAWLGATEIREQFPLFPWAGVHPMSGLDPARDHYLACAPSMIDIARDAGIDIGRFVGTDIEFVATTDLVIRIGQFPVDRLVFWSVKPKGPMRKDRSGDRVIERLELERRYAVGVGAKHKVFTGDEITPHLRKNLLWLKPPRSHLQCRTPDDRHPFTSIFNALNEDMCVATRIATTATACRLSAEEAHADFRAAAWLGEIDIDLTRQIAMPYPVRRDINGTKAALRSQLMGDA